MDQGLQRLSELRRSLDTDAAGREPACDQATLAGRHRDVCGDLCQLDYPLLTIFGWHSIAIA